MLDMLLINCRVIDGTRAPWFRANIGIKDGKIKSVSTTEKPEAKEIVDGEDHFLAPGFIDIHTHSDSTILDFPYAESRVFQGITTEIGGACGISVAPVSSDEKRKAMLIRYIGEGDYSWNSVDEFLTTVESKKPSVNFGTAVGHGSIRIAAMGFDERKATSEEMNQMKDLLRESIEQGAFGFSSGLIYPPGCYADTEELIELCKVLPKVGGFYETHMRGEGSVVVESVREAIEICRQSGAPLEISHHKVIDKKLWQKACFETTRMIEDARREGLDVQCDQYPYIAAATTMDSNVPLWAFEGGTEAMLKRLQNPIVREKLKVEADKSHEGRWQDIFVAYVGSEKNQWAVGKNLVEIGEKRGTSACDACFDLLIEEDNIVGELNYCMHEDDVKYIMKKPYVMMGTDGQSLSMSGDDKLHPRNYGSTARILGHYCRDEKHLDLEEAIWKMSALPAARLGLRDRGLIKEGMWADLVLFDLKEIEDTPTYEEPKQVCRGFKRVYVNGVLTVLEGKHTKAQSGQVLRRK